MYIIILVNTKIKGWNAFNIYDVLKKSIIVILHFRNCFLLFDELKVNLDLENSNKIYTLSKMYSNLWGNHYYNSKYFKII